MFFSVPGVRDRMKKILLYYVPNSHSVAIETLCSEINKTGNKLIVLTQSPNGEFHYYLDKLGVENHVKVYSSRVSFFNYIRHFFFLLKFCRKNKINTVWSHLNTCNLVAVFAQYFIRARVVIFRHHFHRNIKTEGFSVINRNEKRMDGIIGKKAKEIVVPSKEVYNGMVEYEKISPGKISIIPYIYDFNQYGKPDEEAVKKIREKFRSKLLIISASRMIKMKRHALVLPVFNKLIKEGFDIKVMLLDYGEEQNNLETYVRENGLTDHIFFLGLKPNIIDYLTAADLLVHPSQTEASSSLVKEAGWVKKPVIVCSGVGDFDEYISNGQNGFLVQPPDEAAEFGKYIRYVYENPSKGKSMGEALHQKVLEDFTPNKKTIEAYLSKA
jgi:glycosyltransferase involved in cell wall biosynthesis